MNENLFENRRARRWRKAIARRPQRAPGMGNGKRAFAGNRFRHLHVCWVKRFVKEMKGCSRVMDAVIEGKLDRYLKGQS